MKHNVIARELVTYDNVDADFTALRQEWSDRGYNTQEGRAFYERFGPTMLGLLDMRGWANNIGAEAKEELRATMRRAIQSGHLVRGNPPSKTEAERVCLEYQHEIACGVWVYVNPQGEVIGAEVVDFPSHDGAGWRGWTLAV
jgi:hypothetical protein